LLKLLNELYCIRFSSYCNKFNNELDNENNVYNMDEEMVGVYNIETSKIEFNMSE